MSVGRCISGTAPNQQSANASSVRWQLDVVLVPGLQTTPSSQHAGSRTRYFWEDSALVDALKQQLSADERAARIVGVELSNGVVPGTDIIDAT